ncbi:MAG: class II fructose-bisphosphate aldolase [bacterium]|nr:class II fructose-bisphosphate aldolase [bacterium]
MKYESVKELKDSLKGIVEFGANIKTKVLDIKKLQEKTIDRLVFNATLNEDNNIKDASRYLINEIADSLGIKPASIQRIYELMGEGKLNGLTVPATNIRGLTYDVARAMIRSAIKHNAGAFIFEIARTEIEYTKQRPAEYTTVILGAAIKENYLAPVFIQGDHFQVGLKKYQLDPAQEVNAVKSLSKEAIEAGFYNIDIDTSTLVDLSKKDIDEQQRLNSETAAALTAYIRTLEPKGVTVSVGGEIGEVGGKNSTVEEFRSYMNVYKKALNGNIKGISKISVQTGTTHGGIPMPDGSIAKVKLDFQVLEDIAKVSRKEYGLSGTVQHGASTLPDDAFDRFPPTGTSEIHLATGFQNMIFDSEYFPSQLRDNIYKHLEETNPNEKKPDQTQEQFIYKMRKKGFGPFKKEIWDIPEENKKKIREALEAKFDLLFTKLNIKNTLEIVKKYALTSDVTRKIPDTLL